MSVCAELLEEPDYNFNPSSTLDTNPKWKEIDEQVKEWMSVIGLIDESITYADAASMWHESPSVRQKLSELVVTGQTIRTRLLRLLSGETAELLQEHNPTGHVEKILEVLASEEFIKRYNADETSGVFKYCISVLIGLCGTFIIGLREALENNNMETVDMIYEMKDMFNDLGNIDGMDEETQRLECLKNASYDEEEDEDCDISKIEHGPEMLALYRKYKNGGPLIDIEAMAEAFGGDSD